MPVSHRMRWDDDPEGEAGNGSEFPRPPQQRLPNRLPALSHTNLLHLWPVLWSGEASIPASIEGLAPRTRLHLWEALLRAPNRMTLDF